jgi:hypothetical protein
MLALGAMAKFQRCLFRFSKHVRYSSHIGLPFCVVKVHKKFFLTSLYFFDFFFQSLFYQTRWFFLICGFILVKIRIHARNWLPAESFDLVDPHSVFLISDRCLTYKFGVKIAFLNTWGERRYCLSLIHGLPVDILTPRVIFNRVSLSFSDSRLLILI